MLRALCRGQRAFRLAPSLLFVLSAAGDLPAQVPDGWYAVAAAKIPLTGFPGNGGIYLLHPRNRMAMIPVAGLPPSLTGNGSPANWYMGVGADSILFIEQGDLWIVGNAAPMGSSVELNLLQITGTAPSFAASILATVPIGTSSSGGPTQSTLYEGAIPQMALLPTGRILAACPLVNGPGLSGAAVQVVQVNPVGGAVTPVPVQGIPAGDYLNALCVDGAATTAYLGTQPNNTGAFGGTLYAMPVGGGATTAIATFPNGRITQLAWDPQQGTVLVSLWVNAAGGPNVVAVNPVTGATTSLFSGWDIVNVLGQEPSTGCLALGGTPVVGQGGGGMHYDCGAGPVFLSNTTTTGPRGAITGVAMAPNPRPYGQPSGIGPYLWPMRSASGGLPILGNLGFVVATGPTAQFWVGGWARGSSPLPQGVTLLVAPPLVFGFPAAQTISLPIPANNTLVGTRLHLQTGSFVPSGWSVSNGLTVTVL